MEMRIVIIDDVNVYTEGLEFIINAEEGMEVVGILNNNPKVKSTFDVLAPDIILMNRNMLDTTAAKAAFQYRDTHPSVKLIYLSSAIDESIFYEWITTNPDGMLMQDMSPVNFIHSMRDIFEDQHVLSGAIAKELISGFKNLDTLKKFILKARLALEEIDVSEQDLNLYYLLYLKKNNQKMAEELQLSGAKVRERLREIYSYLRVKNRAEAERKLARLMRD